MVAQTVKNLLAVWETRVRSLGWEDPLEKGKATHPVFWLEKSMDWIVHGVSKSQTQLSNFHFTVFSKGVSKKLRKHTHAFQILKLCYLFIWLVRKKRRSF